MILGQILKRNVVAQPFDIGRPLDGEGEAATLLPATLDLGDPPAALLVSHPHQDHYGLLQAAPASWSVHSGAASVRFSVAGCKAKSPDAMGHLRRFGLTSAIPGLPLNADICTNTGLRRNGQKPSSPPSIRSPRRRETPAPHRPALGEVVTTSGEGRRTPSSCVTKRFGSPLATATTAVLRFGYTARDPVDS